MEKNKAIMYFHLALCNGLSTLESYGVQIDYEQEDYDEVKKQLWETPHDKLPEFMTTVICIGICFEDVITQMLVVGKELRAVDTEGDGEDEVLTLDILCERMDAVPNKTLAAYDDETDDAGDADVILQTVFFKEVIFG